ncbi:hypothetical protein CC79DRAFT_1359934 [Sarocladium strictum]
MANPPPPPPPKSGGLSLYDHLLDPNEKSVTISSAPVLYNQQSDSTAESSQPAPKRPLDPSLRFQPIRRPQPKVTKAKTTPKPPPIAAPAEQPLQLPPQADSTNAQPPPQQQKSTLADWTATEDDEWRYATVEKRQRGGRKRKKKQHNAQIETDWDDIYDPTRPTNVDEYLRSDEKVDEVREWKALLYRHRTEREQQSDLSDDSEAEARPAGSNQFAPPPSYNFAPPPISPPPPPADPIPPPPPPELASTQPGTISAAPIRYTQTVNDDEEDEHYSPPATLASDTPPVQTSLPGQANFATRLMKKYGWTSGTGLGASSSGIVNALHVKVEKRKKRSDAEGGGWADPANKGKILGGQLAPSESAKEQQGRGKMSEVIVLENMLENMPNLQEEISAGLGQEIGEECGEKYGRVDRIYIDQERKLVFIKFTDQISALRVSPPHAYIAA